jgi:hypothetical protein
MSPLTPESSGGEEKGPPPVDSIVPVVGIGASAGGLDAFERFFSHTPVENGFAFVVIQHLAPRHASILRDLIARNTPIACSGSAERRCPGSQSRIPKTIYKAERLIQSCEQCYPDEADTPFQWLLAEVTRKHGKYDFVMAELARCQSVRNGLLRGRSLQLRDRLDAYVLLE